MNTILTVILGSAAALLLGEVAARVAWPFLTEVGLTLWWANDKLSWRLERWLLNRTR